MANKVFAATTTNGNTSGALDSIKYATLTDGDLAIVGDLNEECYLYRFESSSTANESIPQVVNPQDNFDGEAYEENGRWILMDISMEDLKVYGNAVLDGTISVAGASTVAALTSSGLVDADTFRVGGGGATVTTIENDDTLGGASASDTKLCTQGNVKAYVDNAAGAGFAVVSWDLFAGYIDRPIFTWVDDDSISISPFRCHMQECADSTEGFVKSDTDIEIDITCSGDALDWHYVYVDQSWVHTNGTTLNVAAAFAVTTTPPTWSDSKNGWYNSKDRCIGAFPQDASNDLIKFVHDGGRLLVYLVENTTDFRRGPTYPKNDWSTTWTLNAPSFSTAVRCKILTYPDGDTDGGWVVEFRPTGSAAAVGQVSAYAYRQSNFDTQMISSPETVIFTDSSQQVDVQVSKGDNDCEIYLYELGYYFPKGM